MARHAFTPFTPRVEIYEVVSGFVAAAAMGIAAQYTDDLTVPGWLLVTLFFAGLALWIGAVLWLFAAHRRMAALTANVPVRSGGLSVDSSIWGYLGPIATTALAAATVVAFVLAVRPDPSFASPYDGQDPTLAKCVDAAVRTPLGADGPALLDLSGRKVGHVELRASPGCGTMWTKIYLDNSVAPSLAGQQVVLVMDRPADGAQARYVLPLQGGTEGFSNMISVGDTCVRAEVYFAQGPKRGPVARSACMS
jgi:hypothetical protein